MCGRQIDVPGIAAVISVRLILTWHIAMSQVAASREVQPGRLYLHDTRHWSFGTTPNALKLRIRDSIRHARYDAVPAPRTEVENTFPI